MLLAAVLVAAACASGARDADMVRGGATTAAGDTIAPAGLAPDDCVRGEPEPALLAAPTGSSRPRFQRQGKLEATEDLRLDDTTSLRIIHGGCAHYVETYAFTVRGAVRDTADSRYWVEWAAKRLRTIPVVETRKAQLEQMVSALDEAARAPTSYTYGEPLRASEMALVWFTVQRTVQGGVVVEVVFDVAL